MVNLDTWIRQITDLCSPDRVYLCDGSEQEYQTLCKLLVDRGTFIPLNPKLRPDSFLCRSNPKDVARVESCTFVCPEDPEDAGPNNNWQEPQQMRALLNSLFKGCMRGRTLYIIPFCMGPLDSPYRQIGVEITDSPYVVCSMRIMAHIGTAVLAQIREGAPFVPCLHSVGMPLAPNQKDVAWPCNLENRYIVHFPQDRSIFSFGSGYGGNALLGKKSLALRIASTIGREEGWLAEHMLILGITNPGGKKRYFAAAFPSACGKTNLAMLTSELPGWTIECVGDDIAWMHVDSSGTLRAINPESGFFGVAPGTSMRTNPIACKTCSTNTLFTNVALTADNDVWWEGLTATPPEGLTDWQGRPYTAEEPAAHPNSRFTTPASQCPIIDPNWQAPEGVPITAILFGGRRASLDPLVYEATNWNHGIFLGATLCSEQTAAATGTIGKLRHDPFAMLPFCGYNMADYFNHWLQIGKKITQKTLFYKVNWYRKDPNGNYIWPGFAENARILKWIFERLENTAEATPSPIGNLPTPHAIDHPAATAALAIDKELWLQELAETRHYFGSFGARMPKALLDEVDRIERAFEEEL